MSKYLSMGQSYNEVTLGARAMLKITPIAL